MTSESDATLPLNVRPRINTRGAVLPIDRHTHRAKRPPTNIYREQRRLRSHTQRAAAMTTADQSVASFHHDAEPLLSPRTTINAVGGARSEDSDESDEERAPPVVTFRIPLTTEPVTPSPTPLPRAPSPPRPRVTQSSARMNARVQTLPDRWRQFQSDTPREFFAGNKPVWAPRVSNSVHNKMVKWKVMEMYDYDHLRTMDWYVFLEDVVGAVTLDGDVSLFAGTQVTSTSSQSVAPSSAGDRGGASIVDFGGLGGLTTAGIPSPIVRFGGGGGGGGGIGIGGGASALRPVASTLRDLLASPQQPPPTPVADPSSDLDRLAAMRSGGGGGGGGPTPADLRQLATRSFADATEAPASTLTREDSISAVISNAVQLASQAAVQPLAQSGARYADVRRFLDTMHTPEWFDMSDTAEAVQRRRKERLDAQHAIAWFYRPLAVGRFLLSPTYTRLVTRAYTDIMLLTDPRTLRPVKCLIRGTPLSEFMRRRPENSPSSLVRSLFVDLIAEHYFIQRNNRGVGNRFEHDSVRLTQSANGTIAKLRLFFRYDKTLREFYHATPLSGAHSAHYRFGAIATH